MGNKDLMGIPVLDITKDFFLYLIPNLNPTENPYISLIRTPL
jgi:hypothetical protein